MDWWEEKNLWDNVCITCIKNTVKQNIVFKFLFIHVFYITASETMFRWTLGVEEQLHKDQVSESSTKTLSCSHDWGFYAVADLSIKLSSLKHNILVEQVGVRKRSWIVMILS